MRKEKITGLILIIGFIIFLGSCSSVPAWVKSNNLSNHKEGCLCARGMSGPSYFREDTIEKAKLNARIELAASIKIGIKTYIVDLLTDGGNETAVSHFVKLSESVIDSTVEKSEIIDSWFDVSGEAGPKNYAYAVACVKSAEIEGIKNDMRKGR